MKTEPHEAPIPRRPLAVICPVPTAVRHSTGLGFALLLNCLAVMCALADDTNVDSAMVSYSYMEDFTNGSILSPFVSYQYANEVDASVLASFGVAAPFVSYQYQE